MFLLHGFILGDFRVERLEESCNTVDPRCYKTMLQFRAYEGKTTVQANGAECCMLNSWLTVLCSCARFIIVTQQSRSIHGFLSFILF